MEILFAGDISTDNARAIINEFMTEHSQFKMHIFDNTCQVIPTGMNIVLPYAPGEIIICVDRHSFIAPDYMY